MSSTTPVVFVVEDDEHIRNALSRLLRSGGYSMNVYGSASAFQNGADLTFLTLIKRGHVTRVVVTTATPLSANIQHVCEEEKNRTARELHDDLGQPLAALKLEVSRIDNRAEAAMTALAGADLHTVSTLIDQLVVSVRRIAADLRPAMLDDLSLAPAVE